MTRVSRPRPGEGIRFKTTSAGEPRYEVFVDTAPRGAPRKLVSKTFRTLGDARAFKRETAQRVADGNYTAPSRVTFRVLVEDYLKSRRDVRENTLAGYRDALANVTDAWGERTAQSITRRDVDALMERLETEGGRRGRPLAHRSLVYALQATRQVFAYGVSAGVIQSNPATDVRARRKRKGDDAPVVIWTPAELGRFVAYVDSEGENWEQAAFRLTACGLRRSEVLGLAWSSIDLDEGTVRVEAARTKTGTGSATSRDETKSRASTRTVHVEQMHPGTVTALKALRTAQAASRLAAGPDWASSGLVVVDDLGGGIHPEFYSARWRALVKDAGLPSIRLHSVRHTIATALHRGGVAPADAAGMLGHEVATHLAFYVQSTETGAASAAARLGELLAAAK